jgi:tetratricopeptide (TPR) repeat protein
MVAIMAVSIAILNGRCKRATVTAVKRYFVPFLQVGLALLVAMVFLACQSTPEEIPEDLSKAQMFQRAQEEVDRGNYDQALRYYREFIRRNPDDPGSIMEAEYEIAYIAYKQEEYDVAQERFETMLAQYEADEAGTLPEWPQVLAIKLIDQIEEKRAEDLEPLIRTNLSDDETDAE